MVCATRLNESGLLQPLIAPPSLHQLSKMSTTYSDSLSHSSAILTPSTATASSNTTFVFPREYHFPPFFTRQTHSSTFHAQCQKWSSLILSYCRHHRLYRLSLIDAISTPLFYNMALNKRLSINDAREIIQFMRKEGRAEWVGAGSGKEGEGNVAWIWWRNPEEWAGLIADWVDETGQKNTVLTLYELTESEATMSQGTIIILKLLGGLLTRINRVSWDGSGSVAEES
jgi:ESCRT-II complex subunit VPS25